MSDRWVVYSTFDPDGRAAPHAAEQIDAYRALGFDVLVVDTSPCITETRRRDWDDRASDWFQRPNEGYDFWSYRTGVRFLLNVKHVSPIGMHLILANDSCFGPFVPMEQVMSRFDTLPLDRKIVCGITDSYQLGHHIQSYWIYFRPNVVDIAIDFLESMSMPRGREEAINDGELALGKRVLAEGCELVPYSPVRKTLRQFANFRGALPSLVELGVRRLLDRPRYNRCADTECLRLLLGRKSKLEYLNPSVLFGSHVFYKKTAPFIKKSLFRENVYADPKIPGGLDTSGWTNDQVKEFLDSRRSRRRGLSTG